MKTNEIIAGLRKLCGQGTEYRRTVCRLAADALEAQQKRIAELEAELKDERYRHDRYVDFEMAEAKELERVKAERDAAVETIRKMLSEEYGSICEFCAHDKNKDALCAKPANGSGGWCCNNARWRGVPGREEGNT